MKNMKLLLSVLVIMFVLILGACSNSASTEPDDPKEPETEETDNGQKETEEPEEEEHEGPPEITEPTTVKIFFPFGRTVFDGRMGPIEEALENITLELVNEEPIAQANHQTTIEELIAKGQVPDIFLFEQVDLQNDYFQEMIEPLDDLVERHQFDLSILNPSLIDTVRSLDSEGRLITIPQSNDLVILYYNKEVFDKFGVEYPSGTMSWDEIIELAQKVTGERDGVTYRGLDIRSNILFPLNQRGVNLTDPETGEVTFAQEKAVQEYFELIEKIYSIPGNMPPDDSASDVYGMLGGEVAMTLSSPQFMRWGVQGQVNAGLDIAGNIEFTSPPVWDKSNPVTEPAKSIYHWMINSYSENKDAAFKVLAEFTKRETQEDLTRNAEEMTIWTDDEMKLQFGAEIPVMEGRDVSPMFAIPANNPPEYISKWNQYVDLKARQFIFSDKDINQHLREVAEESEITIKNFQESQ